MDVVNSDPSLTLNTDSVTDAIPFDCLSEKQKMELVMGTPQQWTVESQIAESHWEEQDGKPVRVITKAEIKSVAVAPLQTERRPRHRMAVIGYGGAGLLVAQHLAREVLPTPTLPIVQSRTHDIDLAGHLLTDFQSDYKYIRLDMGGTAEEQMNMAITERTVDWKTLMETPNYMKKNLRLWFPINEKRNELRKSRVFQRNQQNKLRSIKS